MRFEYKVITLKASVWKSKPDQVDHDFQGQLNQQGLLGWSLVGVTPYGASVKAFMKREK
ncbi:hypothetical protein ACFFUB_00030 [Algimonas porphyrae]|uniref:DUF4177 domain-containing protein n=1 Tax=Algimonas porphyrae TaxID=1128113 RepID=A0ABQ5V0C7_9PROT|nr:hypothetical protein [Algimonas porphyrae]GLQ20417.1 hypothetical protein GCM10007854_13720 [Algimonas porphyrae]